MPYFIVTQWIDGERRVVRMWARDEQELVAWLKETAPNTEMTLGPISLSKDQADRR
jgi:hypothetical protein